MPQGRVVLKSITGSKKLADLKTDSARLLYTWLIPNLDVNGCFSGDPELVKNTIFPRLRKTTKAVEQWLQDLEQQKLIIRYKVNDDIFLFVPDFREKQPSLNPKKEAKGVIPLPDDYKIPDDESPEIPKDKIFFDKNTEKWLNIKKEHLERWYKSYPACSVPRELAKMKSWIIANPAKGTKKNWERFIINWLSRQQERGGTK